MANGNDLALGGLGLGLTSEDIVNAPASSLAVSPDLQEPTSAPNIYRGMYNPLAPIGRLAGSAAQAAPTNFDMAFGDSIAVQQLNNKRIWGGEGPVYDAKNPAPFDVWHTAAVGDPPSRILDRAKYLLSQNPDYFRGKNVFSAIGSNDPSQIGAIKEYLQLLKDNGAGHVVVPGMGPGVPDSAVMNKALQSAVEGTGDNFHFFQPQVNWQSDGVHPNSKQMFDQANTVLSKAGPVALSLQSAPASLTPQPPPQNALTPAPPAGQPAGQQASYTPYTGPNADIYNHALYHGVDPELALTTARIESNFGKEPDRAGRQYKGVFQLGDKEWSSMGGTDANRYDRPTQVNLGVSLLAQRQQELADRLGRTPENWEIYTAHQQGVSGFATMMENPNMNAAEAIQKATGGEISLNEARQRIKGNGGNPDGTAGEFLQTWQNKYEHFKGQIGDAPAYATAPVIPGHYGYTSGQSVPNSPYAVGGRVERMVPQPQPNQLGLPPSMSLPEVVANATKAAVQPLQDFADQERKFRALQLWGILGASMRGMKLTPVSYNPFEVGEAGRAPPVSYSPSIGVGGVGTSTQPYREEQSTVQSASAARSAYPPRLRGQT